MTRFRDCGPSTPGHWVILEVDLHDGAPAGGAPQLQVVVALIAPLQYGATYVDRDAAWWVLWNAEQRPHDVQPETIEKVRRTYGPLSELTQPELPPLPYWWAAYQQGGVEALGGTSTLVVAYILAGAD